jgi:hypothetical protein
MLARSSGFFNTLPAYAYIPHTKKENGNSTALRDSFLLGFLEDFTEASSDLKKTWHRREDGGKEETTVEERGGGGARVVRAVARVSWWWISADGDDSAHESRLEFRILRIHRR